MAVDTDYLDDLMKSIEPTIYPDGVPGDENTSGEENADWDEFVQEIDTKSEETIDYDSELASIPEKGADIEPEEVSNPVADIVESDEDGYEDISEDLEKLDLGTEEFDVPEEKVLEAEEIDLDNMSE